MTDLQPVEHKEKKISILKKRKDFLRVARAQVKWVSPGMVVQTCPRDGVGAEAEKGIRVGFTASKKVGSAVCRNRAKRRLREAVRRVMPDKGRAGHDYVIIARAGLEDRAFDEVIRDLKWSLKRLAGLKKDAPAGRPRTPGGTGVSRDGRERA